MPAPRLLGYRMISCTHAAKNSESDVSDLKLKNPIVLLRGLGRSSRFWLGFEKALSARADIILLDLLGTGKTPSRWGRFRVKDHSRDVAHTLKALGVLPCHVVAISFGSMVALDLASHLQDGIVSSTLISGSARFTRAPRIRKKALFALAKTLPHPLPKHAGFARYLVSKEYLRINPELPEIWDRIYEEEGFSRFATVGQLVAASFFGGRKVIENIDSPTFFVVSKADGLVDWRNSVVMSQCAKKGTLYVYDHLGHDIPTEQPLDLSLRVLSFCQSVEAAGSQKEIELDKNFDSLKSKHSIGCKP